ncbi:hypothetical protein BN59_01071 [Legionella massiliensis]|uniref:Uncharacterized protein n=1 Tax=Legionella massiliensis TaxID=1034943 RepID=A0A078KQV8_9GAMM|nr:hypothetical protein BN59_01071 [Legionella massiliensis]CEE12533.1 hypothetical protein BN1094_01071 [Legionella massiliensis]
MLPLANCKIYLEFSVFLLLLFSAFAMAFAIDRQPIYVPCLEVLLCSLIIVW